MRSLHESWLYGFVDTAHLHGRTAEEVAAQLCAGGADLIQLRAKQSTAEEVQQMARKILPVINRAGVGLVINDYPQIARAVGALACHLGQEDFFDAGFRMAAQLTGCPPDIRLGLSTHAPAQAQRALRAEPDYLAIGPVYATATKPSAPPVTLQYVRWAATHVRVPWFAIGGITLENLGEVLAAGARRVAVVSAILDAPDIVQACQAFKERLRSAGSDQSH